MNKEELISAIKSIINDYGSFGSGEVEIGGETTSPCVNEMGGLIALAEYFKQDSADIEVYKPTSMSSDSMHSYPLNYEDMDEETLVKILELANKYKELQEAE